MPGIGQLILLAIATTLFTAAGIVAVVGKDASRVARLTLGAAGIAFSIATLCAHYISRESWLPLSDNFDALVWLGMLMGVFVFYLQVHRPIGGIELVLLPVAIAMLVGAAVLGRTKPHEYLDSTWSILHRASSYGSVLFLVIAGAAGASYLVQNRNLRKRLAPSAGTFGSLERLEKLTFSSVTIGFALLTIAAVMGIIRVLSKSESTRVELTSPKVLIATAAWVISVIVLHTPINPSLRGRKVAILSVVGMILVVCAIVAAQFTPNLKNN